MGQRTQCLAYGIASIPDGVINGDFDQSGLRADFRKTLPPGERPWEHSGCPETLYETDIPALCLLVACVNSDDDSVPELEPCALEDIEEVYAERLEWVREKWAAFHDFCAARGVGLPTAKLYLSETEVA